MRRMPFVALLLVLVAVPPALAGEELVSVKSSHGAKETADRVERMAKERGMTIFSRIDHADGARKAGMELRPTEVIIFGNPKAGTPLMQCKQTVGIELPLKMLVWQDETGTVRVGYSDPDSLKGRYGITGCDEVLRKMKGAMEKMASDAAGPGS